MTGTARIFASPNPELSRMVSAPSQPLPVEHCGPISVRPNRTCMFGECFFLQVEVPAELVTEMEAETLSTGAGEGNPY